MPLSVRNLQAQQGYRDSKTVTVSEDSADTALCGCLQQLCWEHSPVVVAPRKTLCHILQAGEALHQLDDLWLRGNRLRF
jgi:hypothetical protein